MLRPTSIFFGMIHFQVQTETIAQSEFKLNIQHEKNAKYKQFTIMAK